MRWASQSLTTSRSPQGVIFEANYLLHWITEIMNYIVFQLIRTKTMTENFRDIWKNIIVFNILWQPVLGLCIWRAPVVNKTFVLRSFQRTCQEDLRERERSEEVEFIICAIIEHIYIYICSIIAQTYCKDVDITQ